MCLTETHKKVEVGDHIENISTLRKVRGKDGERLGGGLQIMMKKTDQINLEKQESKSSDILEVDGICFGREMKIILVYFDVRRNNEGRKNNSRIRKETDSTN